ncbi:MAG: hypothetical protein JOZ57_02850 [Abitibacteriaceae bacterium]|nr:hypothetical protein [Abditibacteriaceae bacterium]
MVPRVEIQSFQVTQSDIDNCRRWKMNDPILFVLQQETGTLWKMTAGGVAIEIMQPYRTVVLSRQALEQWHAYRETGCMTPFEFTAEVRYGRPPANGTTSRAVELYLLDGGLKRAEIYDHDDAA